MFRLCWRILRNPDGVSESVLRPRFDRPSRGRVLNAVLDERASSVGILKEGVDV
jgi:hypothetical protein